MGGGEDDVWKDVHMCINDLYLIDGLTSNPATFTSMLA